MTLLDSETGAGGRNVATLIISELKKTIKSGERFHRRCRVLDKRRDASFYNEFTNDWGIAGASEG